MCIRYKAGMECFSDEQKAFCIGLFVYCMDMQKSLRLIFAERICAELGVFRLDVFDDAYYNEKKHLVSWGNS